MMPSSLAENLVEAWTGTRQQSSEATKTSRADLSNNVPQMEHTAAVDNAHQLHVSMARHPYRVDEEQPEVRMCYQLNQPLSKTH